MKPEARTAPLGRPVGAGAAAARVATDAGPLLLPADDVALPYLRTYGTWAPAVGALLRRVVRPGATYVDVGAGAGYLVRLVGTTAAPGRLVAFEQDPALLALLRENVGDLSPAVEVHAGTPGAGAPHAPPAADRPVDAVAAGRVDVVRIGVPGHEDVVLAGMARTIVANPQLVVVTELRPAALVTRDVRPADVLARYRAAGFEVHLLHGGAPLRTTDDEVLQHATSAGPDGAATLVLYRPL